MGKNEQEPGEASEPKWLTEVDRWRILEELEAEHPGILNRMRERNTADPRPGLPSPDEMLRILADVHPEVLRIVKEMTPKLEPLLRDQQQEQGAGTTIGKTPKIANFLKEMLDRKAPVEEATAWFNGLPSVSLKDSLKSRLELKQRWDNTVKRAFEKTPKSPDTQEDQPQDGTPVEPSPPTLLQFPAKERPYEKKD